MLGLAAIHHHLRLLLVLLHHRLLLLVIGLLHIVDVCLRDQAVDRLILLLGRNALELILVHVNLVLIIHLVHCTPTSVLLLLLLLLSNSRFECGLLLISPSKRELRVST